MMEFDTPERLVIARHDTANGEIQLQQRRLPDGSTVFEIISNGVFLMASYNQTGGRALASSTLEAADAGRHRHHRVLIGGLGMGFTLQEALAREVSVVDVVETSRYIVEWNQTHFGSINDHALAHPNVRLIQDDLYNVLWTSDAAAYSAILLDVDNGPSWLVYEDNVRLYTPEALERWLELLMPGGALGVWSAQPEPEFVERMAALFPYTTEVAVAGTDHGDASADCFIYCGLSAPTPP